jgi:hypothetical protein
MPDRGAFPIPGGWISEEDQVTCLACVRAEDAARSGSKGRGKGAGAAARRLQNAETIGEVRAELSAHPHPMSRDALKEIAELVGCGVQKVRVTRMEMRRRGELSPEGIGSAAATSVPA